MNRRIISLATLAVALGAGSVAQAQGLLVSKDQGFMVLPPQAVPGGGNAMTIKWSPSSRYLVVNQLETPFDPSIIMSMGTPKPSPEIMGKLPNSQISLWDTKSNKKIDLLTIPRSSGSNVIDFGVTGDDQTAYVASFSMAENVLNYRLKLINITSKVTRTLDLKPESPPILEPAPTGNFILMRGQDSSVPTADGTSKPTIAVLNAVTGATIDIDATPQSGQQFIFCSWLDGSTVAITFVKRSTNEWQYRTFSMVGQPQRIVNGRPPIPTGVDPQSDSEGKFEVQSDSAVQSSLLDGGFNRSSVILSATVEPTIKDAPRQCIVTSDGDSGTISPNGKWLAYNHHGVPMVSAIAPCDYSVVMNARMAALRASALSKVKQIGLALMMFAMDNDDKFPVKDENFNLKLNPYLKNADMLNGFVYTFPGGDMTKLENPQDTELGHMDIPGGRVVVYADGHAKYVSD